MDEVCWLPSNVTPQVVPEGNPFSMKFTEDKLSDTDRISEELPEV